MPSAPPPSRPWKSDAITLGVIKVKKMALLEPVIPGKLLSEEFLKPMGISQYRLAKEIGVPAQRD
jgi:hypothetical protein